MDFKPSFQPKYEDLIRFFKDRNVDKPCPCCGNPQWDMIRDDDTELYMLTTYESFDKEVTEGMPLITVACNKCYYVRNHAALPILKWIEDNPKKDEEDGGE